MKSTLRWKIYLPFKFLYTEDINDIKKFTVNDISLRPLIQNNNIINIIFAEFDIDIPDYIKTDMDLPITYMTDLYKQNVCKVGTALQKFADSYSRVAEDPVYILFNGDDITVQYEMTINNLNVLFTGNDSNDSHYIHMDKNLITEIINDANKKEHTVYENVKEMSRYATHFFTLGNYEMSIINLAMAAEAFISSILYNKKILNKDHYFNREYIDLFEKEYQFPIHKASFTQKFYDFGLSKAYKVALIDENPEWHNSLEWIYDLRNTIAHGDSLYNNRRIKECNLKYDDMNGILWTMGNHLIGIINWINEIIENDNII